ncbi:hypothetical protein ACJRO7_010911, partial [Eucalyptus globulus]
TARAPHLFSRGKTIVHILSEKPDGLYKTLCKYSSSSSSKITHSLSEIRNSSTDQILQKKDISNKREDGEEKVAAPEATRTQPEGQLGRPNRL